MLIVPSATVKTCLGADRLIHSKTKIFGNVQNFIRMVFELVETATNIDVFSKKDMRSKKPLKTVKNMNNTNLACK